MEARIDALKRACSLYTAGFQDLRLRVVQFEGFGCRMQADESTHEQTPAHTRFLGLYAAKLLPKLRGSLGTWTVL